MSVDDSSLKPPSANVHESGRAWKRWGLLALGLVFFLLFISLGQWQLRRAAQKQVLIDVVEERLSAPTEPWPKAAVEHQGDLQFLRVRVEGHFDADHWVLLDNRHYNGRVGYEVLQLLRGGDGKSLLVNRGWLPASADRSLLPEIETPLTEVSISGYLHRSEGGLQLESEVEDWPRVQSIDTTLLSQRWGLSVPDYLLRLDIDAPGALPREWQVTNMLPAKHQAYAWQWFAMALALLIISVYSEYKMRRR